MTWVSWAKIPGPVHDDPCEHGKDQYVCSFVEILTPEGKKRYLDVYVHKSSLDRLGVCVRYSPDGPDYFSYSTLQMFFMRYNRNVDYAPLIEAVEKFIHDHCTIGGPRFS